MEINEVLPLDSWLSQVRIQDLMGTNRMGEHSWKNWCEIIPQYMPPFPSKDTRPTVQVRLGTSYLRHSAGPLQGFFWDMYGSDFQTVGLAINAIMRAPRPIHFTWEAEWKLFHEKTLAERPISAARGPADGSPK